MFVSYHVITVPFHEEHSDSRGAFLHFMTIDNVRATLSMLDGRAGPGGETLHVGSLRLPAMDPSWLWWWTYKVQEQYKAKECALRISGRGSG
jgi:hypothetical protein